MSSLQFYANATVCNKLVNKRRLHQQQPEKGRARVYHNNRRRHELLFLLLYAKSFVCKMREKSAAVAIILCRLRHMDDVRPLFGK